MDWLRPVQPHKQHTRPMLHRVNHRQLHNDELVDANADRQGSRIWTQHFEIWTFKVQILAQTLKRSEINTKVNSKSRLFKVSLEWSKHTKIWVQILEPWYQCPACQHVWLHTYKAAVVV